MNRPLIAVFALFLAVSVMAETPEEEANRYLQTMITAIAEKNDPMRNRMFIKLRVLGDDSVAPLLAALEHESPDARRYVAFTLGFFEDPRVAGPLLALFASDPEVPVRTAAAEALGRQRSKDAVDPLIAALSDAIASIRQSAAYSLGLIGDPRARPALERAKGDADDLVRFFAEEALVEIEREAARKKQ
ncbi:MAG: HEAT repeat domain-containing protein [Candidatus Eisenbacteria bacterium]